MKFNFVRSLFLPPYQKTLDNLNKRKLKSNHPHSTETENNKIIINVTVQSLMSMQNLIT